MNVSSGTNYLTGTLTGDPKLGPLQNNGGPTPTLAPLSGSPAILAGVRLSTPTAAAYFAGPSNYGLPPRAYFYRVSAFNTVGETLASAEVVAGVPSGLFSFTGIVYVAWSAVAGPVSCYKVYGRNPWSEKLLTPLSHGTTSFLDDGSSTLRRACQRLTSRRPPINAAIPAGLPVDIGPVDCPNPKTDSVKNDGDFRPWSSPSTLLAPIPPLVSRSIWQPGRTVTSCSVRLRGVCDPEGGREGHDRDWAFAA